MHVRIRYATDEIEIRVTDDGVDPRRMRASNGGGHGLIGMRERVEVFGGRFDAGPLPARGFLVSAHLPLEPLRTPIRVLVADDHAVVRSGFHRLLDAQAGIEVIGEAANGLEAVEASLRLRPDVVLMDIRMPGLDGIEATRELALSHSTTRVVILTTYGLGCARCASRASGSLTNAENTRLMGKLISDISISLDGYITGPNDRPEEPMGDGGSVLHEWYFREYPGPDGRPVRALEEVMAGVREATGALLMGRRSYDIAEGWGDEPPFHMPIFVLTHRPHQTVAKKGGTTFTFVSDGLESGVRQALAAAGDRGVGVHGGSATRQCLRAGLLDELILHVIPVLLGAGNRFFEEGDPHRIDLEPLSVSEAHGVTHLRYRVTR